MAVRGKRILIYIYILLFLFSFSFFVSAEEDINAFEQKLAVLVILDQINIEDLAGDYPNIKGLMEKGTGGLMNIRTAVRYDPASGYLTLGSGVRANVPPGFGCAYGFSETVEGEKAYTIYENNTGQKPAFSDILFTDIAKIIEDNKNQNYQITPGLLGQTLKEGNVKVVLLGNADTPGQKKRYAALLAMDTLGQVEEGYVEGFLIKDKQSPFLVKTDYASLLQKIKEYQVLNRPCLLIVHLGDTIRADDARSYVTAERVDFFRKQALANADAFLGQLLNELDLKKDLMLVVTPFPSRDGYNEKNLLTPFIMIGNGIENGLAISATTRREGIIANIDVAPTILNYFGLSVPDIMLGYPIASRSQGKVFPTLYEMNQQIKTTNVQRAYLIKPYVALQIIVSFGFLALFFLKKAWLKMMRPFILANLTVPFILLFLPIFSTNGLGSKYLWLFAFMIIITAFLMLTFRDTLVKIAIISLITALGILVDLIFGAPLMKTSVLGYDPIGGSRYYGLGNEYMGVLIGSILIGLMALLDKYKSLRKFHSVILLIFLSTLFFIMSPQYGSNVGGTISAFGAFALNFLMLLGIKIGWRHLGLLVVALVETIVILFLVISPYFAPSHISKTVELIKANGWQTFGLIIERKLAMNYKLLRYTVWTRALLASMLVLAALLYRPPYLLKTIFQKYPNLYRGFIGTGAGCLLAFAFNDSGIVAAATMMIFIALPALLLVIDELK